MTQFENESEKYYKNPNNFQYELVKTGTFPCILGILDAQKYPNLITNISSQKIFYTVISLNIKWSHIDFAIQIMIFLKKFF